MTMTAETAGLGYTPNTEEVTYDKEVGSTNKKRNVLLGACAAGSALFAAVAISIAPSVLTTEHAEKKPAPIRTITTRPTITKPATPAAELPSVAQASPSGEAPLPQQP